MRFIDSNIVLRYRTRDDEVKASACLALFQKVKAGTEDIVANGTLVTEVVYVLSSKRGAYQLPRDEIAGRLIPILSLPGLRLAQKRMYLRGLELYALHPFLDIEDALAVAYTELYSVGEILSYDRHFDRLPDLKRVEP